MFERIFERIAAALRILLTVLTAVVVAFSFYWVLTRPWREARERGDQIELTVMHWGAKDEDQIVEQLVQDFKRDPVNAKINIKRINTGGTDPFYTKLQTMMAAGVPPDVFYLPEQRVTSYASKGQLLPLEPFLVADRDAGRGDLLSDFYKPVLDCFRYDGQVNGRGEIYGLPKDFTTVGFYYNKDLFRRAGIAEPPDDWTWDDFLEAARAIGSLPECYGAEFVHWPAMIRSVVWTAGDGLDVATRDFRRVIKDDPRVNAALEALREWRFNPTVPRTFSRAVLAGQASSDMFLSGKVGLNGPLGRWMVPTFRRVESFDWDFAPLPHFKGSKPSNVIFTTAWGISSKTKHKNEAWALVRHLTGAPGQTLNSEKGLAIPGLRSVAESPAFKDPLLKPERDQVFLDATEFARPITWPPYPEFESLLDATLQSALVVGSRTVTEALGDLDRVWAFHESSPLRRDDYPAMPWRTIAIGIAIPLIGVVSFAAVRWWRGRPGRVKLGEDLAGLLMSSPWTLGLVVFTLFPVVLSLLLAFTQWNGMVTLDFAQWVGLGNLKELLLYDERFRASFWVTLYYAALAVPLSQLAALTAAFLMNYEVRGIGFFRSAWYLPSVLAGVGVAVLWQWVFNGQQGLLNRVLAPALALVGARPPDWLGVDARVFGVPAFAIMGLWTLGGTMMIYLAGLKAIPQELYEAARIDGAGPRARLLNVTLPMLSPVIFFNFIMAIIASFQVFVQSYVMTSGGPGDATRFFVLYLYNKAFDFHDMGYASMMAWLLLLVILGLTVLVMRGSRRFVYYEGLRD